jgi:hypothetical protein
MVLKAALSRPESMLNGGMKARLCDVMLLGVKVLEEDV